MAFKVKETEKTKPGQDCEDFKPMYFNTQHCTKSNRCNFKEQNYISEEYKDHKGRFFGDYCIGTKYKIRPLPKADPRLINK